jgi:hypothetical protein
MAKIREQNFLVSPTGVGRLDYSQDIQKSVEPVVHSWQETYEDLFTFPLLPGATNTVTVNIDAAYMLLLYEFYLSCYPASDIYLEIDGFPSFPPIVLYTALSKIGYQYIDIKLEKGIDLRDRYQPVVTNLGVNPIDCYYSAHGIKTARVELQ